MHIGFPRKIVKYQNTQELKVGYLANRLSQGFFRHIFEFYALYRLLLKNHILRFSGFDNQFVFCQPTIETISNFLFSVLITSALFFPGTIIVISPA